MHTSLLLSTLTSLTSAVGLFDQVGREGSLARKTTYRLEADYCRSNVSLAASEALFTCCATEATEATEAAEPQGRASPQVSPQVDRVS